MATRSKGWLKYVEIVRAWPRLPHQRSASMLLGSGWPSPDWTAGWSKHQKSSSEDVWRLCGKITRSKGWLKWSPNVRLRRWFGKHNMRWLKCAPSVKLWRLLGKVLRPTPWLRTKGHMQNFVWPRHSIQALMEFNPKYQTFEGAWQGHVLQGLAKPISKGQVSKIAWQRSPSRPWLNAAWQGHKHQALIELLNKNPASEAARQRHPKQNLMLQHPVKPQRFSALMEDKLCSSLRGDEAEDQDKVSPSESIEKGMSGQQLLARTRKLILASSCPSLCFQTGSLMAILSMDKIEGSSCQMLQLARKMLNVNPSPVKHSTWRLILSASAIGDSPTFSRSRRFFGFCWRWADSPSPGPVPSKPWPTCTRPDMALQSNVHSGDHRCHIPNFLALYWMPAAGSQWRMITVATGLLSQDMFMLKLQSRVKMNPSQMKHSGLRLVRTKKVFCRCCSQVGTSLVHPINPNIKKNSCFNQR